jgi:alginate O-acetyltransferase complex protein AlgI
VLFNSYVFLLGFAPIALCGFFVLGRFDRLYAAGWLATMSIVFYGWWNPRYVPILLASILINFGFGRLIDRCRVDQQRRRTLLLTAAIVIDLAALAYFKYADFLVSNLSALSGVQFTIAHVVLPLGISFYTFTQLAYLIDTYRNKATEKNFLHYVLFVTYFPHLIAGPIIHHKDVMPQFAKPETYRFNRVRFTIGAVFLIIGLFKKCFLADGVAVFAAPVFDAAEQGHALAMLEAWGGALAYTFQLYFDFSGYSDMAVGLSLMLNIKLPFNFNSPYKALSISDFWKRWHISLSTFLRDYVYISLGGNRAGPYRRYQNLMLTMLIGGLWHGAGWTFVAWGGLHGLYLVINHQWTAMRARWSPAPKGFEIGAGAALTFFAVVVAWVFFRATSFQGAATLLKSMAGIGTSALPPAASASPELLVNWTWCIVLLMVTTFAPNTQEFVARHISDRPTIAVEHRESHAVAWASPGLAIASGLGLLAALALMNLSRPSEFLYFNF